MPNSDKAVPKADVLGLDIWPGALALCNYLAVHRGLVHGRRAIELGAGMGLPGLLAGQLGARECLLTDYEPLVRARRGSGRERAGFLIGGGRVECLPGTGGDPSPPLSLRSWTC